MRNLWSKVLTFLAMIYLILPELALAGGEKAAAVVIVSDTRKLSGLMAWWGSLYNESHLYFAILTVILIPIIGVIFGTIADLIMGHIGIDLTSRDLAEH